MPRKKELEAVQVLEYFGTAPLEAARLVLQLAGRAVQLRTPKPQGGKPAPSPRKGAPQTAGAPAVAEIGTTTVSAVPPAAAPAAASPPPRRRPAQAPPAGVPPAGEAPPVI